MNDTWKEFLNSSQFDEGRELYKAGKVRHIEGGHNKYNVIVKDGKDYTVSIFMVGSRLLDMTCSCKEAESLGYCKHGAASLFALAEKGLIRLSVCDPTVLVTIIRKLNDRYSDEDGWIEKRWSPVFAERFEKILHDMLFDLMNQRDYLSAFEILKAAFMVLNEIRMYDDEEQLNIAFLIEQQWHTVIRGASENQRDQMYEWFIKMKPMESKLICGESISYVLNRSFYDVKYLKIRLDEVREEINNVESENELNTLLDEYKYLLEACSIDLDEYEKWLETHDSIASVKDKYLNLLMEKKNYGLAIRTVERYLEKERVSPTGLKWKSQLLGLYHKVGNTKKEKDLLKDLVFEEEIKDPKLIDILYQMCDENEWQQVKKMYLDRYPEIAVKILSDRLTDEELLKALEHQSKEVIDSYSVKLMDRYPEQFLRIYTKLLNRMVIQKQDNNFYIQMKDCMLKMDRLPNGREAIERFIDRWRNRFEDKGAIMEILYEVDRQIKYRKKTRHYEQGKLDI